jgi:stress-induced morphogen
MATAFPGDEVDVIDLTGTHDHYQVSVISAVFDGLTRLQCQRRVMDAFSEELKSGEVHALTIKAQSKKHDK